MSFTPHSCSKIINSTEALSSHGCPFKTDETKLLGKKLKTIDPKFNDDFAIEDITSHVESHQYRAACGVYFKTKHEITSEETFFVPNHPNQYFEQSRKYLCGENKPSAVGAD